MTPLSFEEKDCSTTKAPVILALEASGDFLSVALWKGGVVRHHEFHAARHGHATHVATLVERMMQTADVTYAEITHIAAGRGPGSFTGTRVALAAAKGLCLATGAVGLGVNGLAALAAQHCGCFPILVSAETRRGPCYAQFFDSDGTALTSTFETLPNEIASTLPTGVVNLVIAGWLADELAARLSAGGKGVLIQSVNSKARVDATHIATFAAALVKTNRDGEEMTPLYLAPAYTGPAKHSGK